MSQVASAEILPVISERQYAIVAREWRTAWGTGVAAMLGMGLCGSVMATIASLFIRPLGNEFGWTPGQIGLAQNAALLNAFVSPFIGRWVDQNGARQLMLTGMIAMICGYLGLTSMSGGSIWLFYLFWTGTSLLSIATTGVGFSFVLGNAFPRSLGFSLAVGRSGLAISSSILPIALYAIIATYGWRAGYATMAALILVLALPAAWLWVERGTQRRSPRTGREAGRPKWLSLILNRKVATVALAAALAYAPIIALLTQLQPILVSKGITPATAAAMIGLMGVSSFVGAIITGLFLDRFWAPAVAVAMLTGAAAGACLLLWYGDDPVMAAVALLLLGLGQGAEMDIVSFIVARYFGMRVFASVYGLSVFAIAIGTAIGSSFIGLLYDARGNYDLALWIAAGSLFAAGLCYLTLGRYPNRAD